MRRVAYFNTCEGVIDIQGADDKLGQFLDQDIEASANHRNVLRHSLESYPPLVSPNLNKLPIVTKICRQSTKPRAAVQKALRAGRNLQEIARFLKVPRSLVYLLKKVLNQNQGCWGGRCHS